METTMKTKQTSNSVTAERSTTNGMNAFWEMLEFNRFGIISMLVVILGCVGGMAASFGAGADALKLAMIAFPTIISLALILAVAPMKTITYLSVIAVILDLVVLVF
jgi:hypothetical protein